MCRGPLRIFTPAIPDVRLLHRLSERWPLGGADLWRLGLAVTLRARGPEVAMPTFDEDLRLAAQGEGLTPHGALD
ncbi:MAG TPA: hypothetical protein VNO81_06725 [Candidatus Nitrosotenuis sp.]|nr:hypothetical protein [Candidatus Nitrosotenuis sp.]